MAVPSTASTVAAPDPKDLDKLTEAPQMAAKEPVGQTEADVEHLEKLRDDALMQVTRQAAKSIKFNNRLERRHALTDPEGAKRRQDAVQTEYERLVAQEKAFAEAQQRAAEWIAPDTVEGRTDEVFIRLQPPVEQRKYTIHIRALGEIDDGFIMLFEDPPDPDDPKLGRVGESERFGTKNRVRVKEIERESGKTSGEITYLGYKDWGPLRLHPGDYVAVVVDMNDGQLAQESFSIVPDWDEDGKSDQVEGAKPTDAPERAGGEEERAAAQEQQVTRQRAKAVGREGPEAPKSDAKTTTTPEQKKAQKETPEARASKKGS